MKLALLIGLTADKRTGVPLSPVLQPFDEALKQFKAFNDSREGPAEVIELWSGGAVVKRARMQTVVSSEAATQAKGKGKAKTNAAKGPSPEEIEAAKKAAEEAAAAEAAKKAAEEAAAAEAAKKAAEEAAKGTTPPISGEGNQPPPDE